MAALLTIIVALLFNIIKANGQTICADYAECKNNAQITNGIVECSGDESCQYTPIQSNEKAGYVKCSGEQSCGYSTSVSARDTVYCTGWQSCREADVSSRKVYCAGFSSCHGATIDAKKLHCSGSGGCHSSTITSDGKVNCGGSSSCRYSPINAGGNVDCAGKESCEYATITTTKNILCSTESACDYATLKAGESVKFYGKRSGFAVNIIDTPLVEVYGDTTLLGHYSQWSDTLPVIDSGSLSTMTVKLLQTESHLANPKAYVKCRSGATCHLFCESSGCYGINYQCEAGATCNINPSGCTSGGTVLVNGAQINCPNIATTSSETMEDDDDEPLDDEDIDEHDRNDALHADANKICTLESECEGETITLSSSRLYCRGLDSCKDTVINNNYDSYDLAECSGEKSCFSSNIYADGSMTCSGEASCKSSSRLRVEGTIECFGSESCANISNIHWSAQYMSCQGAASCEQSNILGNGYSAYVYCRGNRACSHAVIDSIEPTFCDAKYSCSSATLSVDDNRYAKAIFCEGVLSCKKAIINPKVANAYVEAEGYLSAFKSLIYGENIRAESAGYRSFAYSTIDSKGGGKLRASFYGYEGGYGATFICRKNTSCTLTCRGTSCTNMDYLCETGAIQCGLSPPRCSQNDIFQGINCPTITNIDGADIEAFLQKKEIERMDDEVYKQIEMMIDADDQEFESLINNDYDYEDEEESLFVGEIGVMQQSITVYNGVFLFMMVMMIGLCAWFLSGNNKKEYQPL